MSTAERTILKRELGTSLTDEKIKAALLFGNGGRDNGHIALPSFERPGSVFQVLELCAGGGGQALGLERAGFELEAAVEIDGDSCNTLRHNRPQWTIIEDDIRNLNASSYRGIDLIAAGVPCPPFTSAGLQEGSDDERDLFPDALDIIETAKPRAVLFENVRGFMDSKFDGYRTELIDRLSRAGYTVIQPRVLNAAQFGVPQLRPRFVMVAFRNKRSAGRFSWPGGNSIRRTVGEALLSHMAQGGWPGAIPWAVQANRIAPTLVGGSKKHGGPDLGPTRAKREWASLGVDGLGVADAPPGRDFPISGSPRLTVEMAAAIQGFPSSGWKFCGSKTGAYRQVGNAFPPPVSEAVGRAVLAALNVPKKIQVRRSVRGAKVLA